MEKTDAGQIARQLFSYLLTKPYVVTERWENHFWQRLGIDAFDPEYEWVGKVAVEEDDICEYYDGGFQFAVTPERRDELIKSKNEIQQGRWCDRGGIAYVEVELSSKT